MLVIHPPVGGIAIVIRYRLRVEIFRVSESLTTKNRLTLTWNDELSKGTTWAKVNLPYTCEPYLGTQDFHKK